MDLTFQVNNEGSFWRQVDVAVDRVIQRRIPVLDPHHPVYGVAVEWNRHLGSGEQYI